MAGADVDARDDEGNSPMHFAVSRGAVDSVRLLLRYGGDALATNAQHKTPITMAAATRQATAAAAAAASSPPPARQLPTGGDAASVDVKFTEEGSLGCVSTCCLPTTWMPTSAQLSNA